MFTVPRNLSIEPGMYYVCMHTPDQESQAQVQLPVSPRKGQDGSKHTPYQFGVKAVPTSSTRYFWATHNGLRAHKE